MAIIVSEQTSINVTVQPQHVFGRHPTAATHIVNPESSRTHAVIIWDGESWILKDTSTNGTFINGKRLSRGLQERLNVEDRIQFGGEHTEAWFVKDISPPECLLLPLTIGLSTIHLNGITALPSESDPQISIYKSACGQWVCETSTGIFDLKMGDRVGTEDKQWRFVDAQACVETEIIRDNGSAKPMELTFKFDVSQNEEHVSLMLDCGDDTVDLEVRNHHYLILLLARKYQSDQAEGLSKSESGWIDKDLLCKMVGQSGNHVNIQIYRFRKQFIDAYPYANQTPQVIERRTGEIRFSPNPVEIMGGVNLDTHSEFTGEGVSLN